MNWCKYVYCRYLYLIVPALLLSAGTKNTVKSYVIGAMYACNHIVLYQVEDSEV